MAGSWSFCCIVICFVAFFHVSAAAKAEREVKIFKHQCKGKSDYTILHVKAKKIGSHDTVHYLWTTIHYPTVVVAQTNDSSVHPVIEWNDCWNYSLSFKPAVKNIAALVLSGVYEYNDPDDNQDANKHFIKEVLPEFSWSLDSCTNGTDGNPDAVFTAKSNSSSEIKIELKAFSVDDYDKEMPHEKVSPSSSRITISLDQLPTSNKKSRYAFSIAFLKPKGTDAPKYETSRSIDDEHTPGIFKLWKLSLKTGKEGKGFFACWKPVAYSKSSRTHDDQTFSHNFPSQDEGTLGKNATYPRTILSSLLNEIDGYTMKVSFGQSKDEWYQKTRYRSWTGLVGYGDPPDSTISTKVYLILSIGLGVPIVISLLGSLVLVIKRLRFGKKAAYEQIN